MPKIFQYVCDKCSKTKFSEESDIPENWWNWGGMYFCSECFASLVKPISHAIDDVQTYLGSLLPEVATPERRVRVAALITRDAMDKLLTTIPRGKDAE